MPDRKVGPWTGLLALWTASAAAYAGWLGFALSVRGASLAVDMALAGLMSGATALVCRRAAGVPGLGAQASRFWRRCGLTLALSMLGLLVEAAYGFASGRPSLRETPVAASLLQLASVTVAIWTMLRVPVPRRPPGEWLRLALDAGTVVLSLVVFGWYLVVGPRLDDRSVGLSSLLMVSALVMAIALCALMAVKVALAGQLLFDQTVQRMLGLVVLFALPLAVVRATDLPAGLQHLGFAAMIPLDLVLMLSAVRQRRVPSGEVVPAGATARRRSYSLLPYLSVAATLGLLLPSALRLEAGGQVVVGGVVALIALVVARQVTALRDNARLLVRLDASLAELGRQERRFRSLVQHSADVIMVTDADGAVVYVSPAIAQVLGHEPERWHGRRPIELVHPGDRAEVGQHTASLLERPGASVAYQARMLHAGGGWRWLEVVSTNLLHDPSVAGIVTNARDVTTAREFQDRLRHQASHDHLTGLANRSLFEQRLRQALEDGRPACVLLLDLDGFKEINDRYGHAAGDQVLVAVAGRLRGCVRPADLVARLGGDEFALLLEGIQVDQGNLAASRALAALTDPVAVDGHILPLAASVGVAASQPGEAADPDRLLRHADTAMYQVKRQRKASVGGDLR